MTLKTHASPITRSDVLNLVAFLAFAAFAVWACFALLPPFVRWLIALPWLNSHLATALFSYLAGVWSGIFVLLFLIFKEKPASKA